MVDILATKSTLASSIYVLQSHVICGHDLFSNVVMHDGEPSCFSFVKLWGMNVNTKHCMSHDNFMGPSTNCPHLMALWPKKNCQSLECCNHVNHLWRGFSKQNSMKSHSWGSLKLDTLDAFDTNIIMDGKGGEYVLEGKILFTVQYKESRSS